MDLSDREVLGTISLGVASAGLYANLHPHRLLLVGHVLGTASLHRDIVLVNDHLGLTALLGPAVVGFVAGVRLTCRSLR